MSKVPNPNSKLKIHHFIADARDYHKFAAIQGAFEMAGIKLKYEELYCDGNYHAIFFQNKTAEVRKIIKDCKE